VAVDYGDGSVSVVCSPRPWSQFRVGRTHVTCRSTSSHGDESTLGLYILVLGRLRPPSVTNLTASARGRTIAVGWRVARRSDVSGVQVTRTPGVAGAATSIVYEGHGSTFTDRHASGAVYYTYAVTTVDPGGRPSPPRVVSAGFALPELFSPSNGARLPVAPTLRWLRSRKASYYNVQLWRNGRRVLSRWPRTTAVALTRTWVYAGKHYTLAPGVYTWYVWPGLGDLVDARYGKLLGHARFTALGPVGR
jgi:hypothetical protein